MTVLSTQRAVLRDFCELDIEPMKAVFCDSLVMRFGDGIQDRDWIRRWIHRTIERYDTWDFAPWAVVLRDQTAPIGYCGLFQFDDINGQPEIELGYRLAKQ